MFSFSFDAAAGILCVTVMGSWTLPEVERYAREAGLQFPRARQSAGQLRLLIDLSAADVLSQALMAPLAKAGMQYARADDRVALVVGSTLLKLQMKRMIGGAPAGIFLSEREARGWLLSSDTVGAVAG